MAVSPHDTHVTFGELLKYLRRRMQMTQQELGIALGYSVAMIARLESGERRPDLALVKTTYVAALGLQHEPELAARLVELAAQAQADSTRRARPTRSRSDDLPIVPLASSAVLNTPDKAISLPVQLTCFVGREQELAEVSRLLGTTRLLTLTGSGGAGKTRLAIEVGTTFVGVNGVEATGQSPRPAPFPDGVWLVELAPIADPALVADAVALALGLHSATRSALTMLTDHLRDKRLLLLLDNCEHLIQACAELVGALLRACPALHILATSREGLNIPGETRWRIPPLVTDEAVQLFVAHARAAQPGFTLTELTAPVVAQVCERLDGMPLAIELAAARLHAFSVEQIVARLDDRFRLLTGGSRTALPRHQTLRALIDWSYDLLPEAERALLRQLSVFAGGWTLDAAEAAAEALHGSADVLDLLAQLVSKSLVVVDPGRRAEAGETGDGTRYHLLETIRQYAHEKLVEAGEYEAACQRHLAYYGDLAHTASTYWFGLASKAWLDRLETELDNLRAALDWVARNQDVQTGAQLIDWIFDFWWNRGYVVEGLRWIDAVLPPSAAMSDVTRVKRLLWLGMLASKKCDYVQARDRFVEAGALAHHLADERLMVTINWQLSWVTVDDAAAAQLLNDALRVAQQHGWKMEEAQMLYHLGRRMRMAGDYPGATQRLAASEHTYQELQSPYFLAACLGQLGMVALDQGDYVQARAKFEASIALTHQAGDTVARAEWLLGLSTAAVYQGDYQPATAALQEAFPTFYKIDNLYRVAQGLAIAAHQAHDCGHPERAARLLGAAGAIWREFPADFRWLMPELHREYEQGVVAVRAALDPVSFEAAWAEGQQMTLYQAVGYALQGAEAEAKEPLDQRRPA
jgi:non-specific serine/threonine protein kinase